MNEGRARGFAMFGAVLGFVAFGCTVQAPGAGTGADADAGADPKAVVPLTCGGIFDCARACDASGDSCDDACLAKGSPAAREAVQGLVACANENSACPDAACLQEKCRAELRTCVDTSSHGPGEPLGGAAPTGNVPANLVAVWKGLEETIELRADGTVGRSLRIRAATCSYEAIENGTAVASGDTLTLYFTSGTFRDCTGPSDNPYKPTSETFTYTLTEHSANTVLRLEKRPCSSGSACVSGYDKH